MSQEPLTLHDFLYQSKIEPDLRYLIDTIARVGKQISYRIKSVDIGMTDGENMFGENQKKLDVFAHELIKQTLLRSGLVAAIASEEEDKPLEAEDAYFGRYAVAFDPLDGSSLIDVNFAMGSIFSIYKGDSFFGRTGDEQVAALYVMYGPRTTLVIALHKGTHEFILNDVGEFHISRRDLKISDTAKTFGPGDLRACATNPGYDSLVQHWIRNGYKLRYSGGMVPDINHVIMKGEGIFAYPASKENPNGKLRLLFECHPMAMIIEGAGGKATDGTGKRILEIENVELGQRTAIFVGSTKEVEKAESLLSSESK